MNAKGDILIDISKQSLEFSFLTFQDKSLFKQATDSKSDTGYKQLDSNNLSMKSQVS